MRPKHLVQRVQLVKVEPRFRDGQPTSMLIKKHFASSSEACHMFRRRALNSDLTGMAKSEHFSGFGALGTRQQLQVGGCGLLLVLGLDLKF